jgi:adenylate cyclase
MMRFRAILQNFPLPACDRCSQGMRDIFVAAAFPEHPMRIVGDGRSVNLLFPLLGPLLWEAWLALAPGGVRPQVGTNLPRGIVWHRMALWTSIGFKPFVEADQRSGAFRPSARSSPHPVFKSPSRMVTVLAADAAGYSRAMSQDEPRALAALAASRRILDASIASREGRIFSTGGDSVLAEFLSSDQAVRCGVQIQNALAAAVEAGTEVLSYRIGIHAGRVHPSGDDLLGETVNIAARLESIANAGGICISNKVCDGILAPSELDIEEMGSQVLKGIMEPISVSRVRLGEPEQRQDLSNRLSIAILPFRSESSDQHWGEGLADDLIAALSRFKNLAVLARASSFPFGGEPDPRRVASNLGVRFVLAGSIRVHGSRFDLSVQLLDGSSGIVLWADRYRYHSEDLLTVQDRLLENIVGTLAGRLEQAGAEFALRKRTENLGAFDFLLQGVHHADRLDPASSRRAIDCFEKALAIDPNYPAALATAALMRLRAWALHPGTDDLGRVASLAERALVLDPSDSWCHLVVGQIEMYRKQLDSAEVRHKKAHALNPFDARIMALWSPLATYLGKPEEGRAWIERATRLNPLHPAWYETNLGLACYCSRQYEEGAAVYASVVGPQAGVLAGLVACRAQLGDEDGVKRARSVLLSAKPDFSSEVFMSMRPFKYRSDHEHLLEGLRKGRLPN